MTTTEIISAVKRQLAIDLNCVPSDLDGEKDRILFAPARENPGRRPFPRETHHFEMLTMGKTIVVSATPELLKYSKAELAGKSRDDAFSAPFVYGHSLYYVPDLEGIRPLAAPAGYAYETIERDGMGKLYETPGFKNALSYDLAHPRPDVLALVAKEGDNIVGIAGASADCAKLWQIGIDVLPEHRGQGLAAYLTNALALEILRRGFIPYYGTASSNIPSQRVAHRAGFMPAWMCVYHARLDEYRTLPTS